MEKITVLVLTLLLHHSIGTSFDGCDSPQYLEYEKTGVIFCAFVGNFTALFWYDSSNIVEDEPIITLINSLKAGDGYESGEFDISSNGSLIITEVNRGHEKNFTVVKFTSLDQKSTTFVVSVVVTGLIPDGCESPQYLEYERAGVVHCHFQTYFHSVLWYNSTDTVHDAPIVTYSQSGKSGRGYDSREFDIFSNGSLLIHKVGLAHEHNYTVIIFESFDEGPTYFVVRVYVAVKSIPGVPVVNDCPSVSSACLIQLESSSEITCTVYEARPAVPIKWLVRTRYGDQNISTNVEYISNNVTFTSSAATSFASAFSPVLNLFVCSAEFVPFVLETYETLVLVQNRKRNLSYVTPIVKYVALNLTLQLKCTTDKITFIVWKRSFPFDNHYENIPPLVYIENHLKSEDENHLMLGVNGSLILPRVYPEQDGFYGCIYGNGITDGMNKYKIVSYVKPVPEYPVIQECNDQRYCTLQVERSGNLTCVMEGVRPKVKLEWKASNKSLAKVISFSDTNYTAIKTGEIFNIKLTSTYTMVSGANVSVECKVTGEGSDIFPIKSVADLQHYPSEDKDRSGVPTAQRIWIIIFIVPSACLLLLVILRKAVGVKYKLKRSLPEERNSFLENNAIYCSRDKQITATAAMSMNKASRDALDTALGDMVNDVQLEPALKYLQDEKIMERDLVKEIRKQRDESQKRGKFVENLKTCGQKAYDTFRSYLLATPGQQHLGELLPEDISLEAQWTVFENKFGNLHCQHNSIDQYDGLPDTIYLLLVGRTGSGKSATGNTILNKRLFQTSISSQSCTKMIEQRVCNIGTREVRIIDTPGLFDTEMSLSNEDILLNVVNTLIQFENGIHLFLLVMSFTRFTKGEEGTLNAIEKALSDNIYPHCVIILTHSKRRFGGKDSPTLKEFIEHEKGLDGVFSNLLAKVKDRVIAVENSFDEAFLQQSHRKKLLTCLAQIIA